MFVRVSILSIFLVSSSLLGMEGVLGNKSEYTEINLSETTSNTKSITSLESWKAFAKKNELLGDYEVSPMAVAEYQQKYEFQTDLPVLPEVVAVWSNVRWSQAYAEEVEHIHALLRRNEEFQEKLELPLLQNLCIKKACTQLAQKEKRSQKEQELFGIKFKWAIALPTIAVVLGIAFMLELLLLVPSLCRH